MTSGARRPLAAEALAKINRELRVGAFRPDGFHEIRSRIVSIDLADRIEVSGGRGKLEFSCDNAEVGEEEPNLVVRAARILARRLGREPDARVRLEKRIPAGRGLGGGSADAAVTLTLLAKLWDTRLSREELRQLSAELGSDVPFFLTGGEAEVSGRGEKVTPIEDAPPVDLLLLLPPFPISTSAVYGAHRRRQAGKPAALPERLQVETSESFFGPNDLALAVLEIRPEMQAFLDSAREIGSEYAITGSGSAIVLRGVGPGGESWLSTRHPNAKLVRCRTLGRKEYGDRTETSGGC